jgi:quercetin dioxygenase-like cupin family protein
VLATCAQINDALFAAEVRMPPGAGPPVLHRHAPGEIYYVIEGEFTFYTVDEHDSVQRVTAGVGASVPLAGGTPPNGSQ